ILLRGFLLQAAAIDQPCLAHRPTHRPVHELAQGELSIGRMTRGRRRLAVVEGITTVLTDRMHSLEELVPAAQPRTTDDRVLVWRLPAKPHLRRGPSLSLQLCLQPPQLTGHGT